MPFKVVWTKGAIRRLQGVYDYYVDFVSESVAVKVTSAIVEQAIQLETFPLSGQIETTTKRYRGKYRYLVCKQYDQYKIIYSAKRTRVYVIAVIDTRQDPLK